MTGDTRYRIYTGPVLVRAIAERLRRYPGWVRVTLEGTEHVYVETDRTVDQLLGILGPTWSWRDIGKLP